MKLKIILLFFSLALSEISHAADKIGITCNADLQPKDPASKYIEVLQCMSQQLDFIQAQVDALKTKVVTASTDAATAQAAAADAKAAAERAAQYSQDTNSKLDRMFKKSFMQ